MTGVVMATGYGVSTMAALDTPLMKTGNRVETHHGHQGLFSVGAPSITFIITLKYCYYVVVKLTDSNQ